jgi:shikimate kinase
MKYLKLYEDFMEGESLPGIDIPKDKVSSYQSKPIILIGPQGSGKSTTAKALAKKLGIPLVETDMCMIDIEYEKACKNEPGVEVEIKRVGGGINYSSNKEYEFCVIKQIFEKYGNSKIVLDVGGSHAHWDEKFSGEIMKMFNSTPNIFIFTVSDDESETYTFLKGRRSGRGEGIKPEQESKFQKVISDLNNTYRDTQKVYIIKQDKTEKTTEEIVDELIGKLK